VIPAGTALEVASQFRDLCHRAGMSTLQEITMHYAARNAGIGLALASLFALAACDVTEPAPIVEARIAHAAPGLGTAQVALNGVPTWQLPAGQNVFFPLNPATHSYTFTVGAQVAQISVPHDADINAVILLNFDDPTARHFRLERLLGEQRIMVINGDFTTTEPMTVEITGPGATVQETIDPAEHFIMEPAAGDFQIRIRPGGAEEFVDLQPITIPESGNGFLVLVPFPDGAPAQPYTRILF
jgi:hypothetical protein